LITYGTHSGEEAERRYWVVLGVSHLVVSPGRRCGG